MEQKKFKDPLREVETKYRAAKELREWSRFQQAYDTYKRKLNHLIIIYNSYAKRYPVFKRNMELYLTFGKRDLTENELEELLNIAKDLEFIEIDYEDFFIHSKILLDYVTRLSIFFFNLEIAFSPTYYHGIPEKYTSFNKHKDWLNNTTPSLSHEHIPNEYKDIVSNTPWFEELKEFRDHTLVHPFYFRSRGMIHFKEKDEAIPVWFGDKEANTTPIKLPDIEKMFGDIIDFLTSLNEFYLSFLTGRTRRILFSYESTEGKIWYR
jgi:hypothetical protein